MLSIDISNTYLYLVEGEFSHGRVKVLKYDAVETPEGSVKSGVIVGAADLAQVIRETLDRGHYKSKNVVITINSSAVVTREVTVPVVPPREMYTLLLGEINQANPSKQEYILDYVILDQFNEQGADVCRVLCIVVPKAVVTACRDLIEKNLGLKAYSMGVGLHNVYKFACLDDRISTGGATIIADINEDELRVYLVEGTSKIFYRSVQVSVAKDVVDSEYILSSFNNNLISDRAKQEKLIATASENISKMIQFQSMKNKAIPVERIFICSDLSTNSEIATGIAETVGLPAESLSAPGFVLCDSAFPYSQFAKAVGALIEL